MRRFTAFASLLQIAFHLQHFALSPMGGLIVFPTMPWWPAQAATSRRIPSADIRRSGGTSTCTVRAIDAVALEAEQSPRKRIRAHAG